MTEQQKEEQWQPWMQEGAFVVRRRVAGNHYELEYIQPDYLNRLEADSTAKDAQIQLLVSGSAERILALSREVAAKDAHIAIAEGDAQTAKQLYEHARDRANEERDRANQAETHITELEQERNDWRNAAVANLDTAKHYDDKAKQAETRLTEAEADAARLAAGARIILDDGWRDATLHEALALHDARLAGGDTPAQG